MDVKLGYQKIGYNWLISIQGRNKQEIMEYFWLFVNHGATNIPDEQLNFVSQTQAIFSAESSKIKRAFRSMERIRLENHYEQDWGKGRNRSELFQKKLLLGAKMRVGKMEKRTDLAGLVWY